MPVIEAQRPSILVPHDHRHISHERLSPVALAGAPDRPNPYAAIRRDHTGCGRAERRFTCSSSAVYQLRQVTTGQMRTRFWGCRLKKIAARPPARCAGSSSAACQPGNAVGQKLLDGDDDLALGVPFAEIPQRLGHLAQPVAAVDDRSDVSRLAELNQRRQALRSQPPTYRYRPPDVSEPL
jgi:hypothetical protein